MIDLDPAETRYQHKDMRSETNELEHQNPLATRPRIVLDAAKGGAVDCTVGTSSCHSKVAPNRRFSNLGEHQYLGLTDGPRREHLADNMKRCRSSAIGDGRNGRGSQPQFASSRCLFSRTTARAS